MKTIREKVDLLKSYAKSMSSLYNHDGSRRSLEIAADYQKKCEALITELSNEKIPDGYVSIFEDAKNHFAYFKK